MTKHPVVSFAVGLWISASYAAAADRVADHVTLELTSDRDVYLVGEPATLTLTVTNVGTVPVFGRLRLDPYMPKVFRTASLLICRADMPCVEFIGEGLWDKISDMHVPIQELAPGAKVTSTLPIATNPSNGRFVFDVPGSYELRWKTNGLQLARPVKPHQGSETVTISVRVQASAVPPAEADAFEAYSRARLGHLAQYNPNVSTITDGQLLAARMLVQRFPGSPYSKGLHAGLAMMLESRKRAGTMTQGDQEMLDMLHARFRAMP